MGILFCDNSNLNEETKSKNVRKDLLLRDTLMRAGHIGDARYFLP